MGGHFIDDLNIETPKKPVSGGPGGKTGKKLIIIAIGIVFVFTVFAAIIAVIVGGGSKKQADTNTNVNTDIDNEASKAKSIAEIFITKFYNYNKLTYLDQRLELEKMMTTEFLDTYKKVFYDTNFEKQVLDSYLTMSISYDRFLFKKTTNGYQVKVTGYIKYINSKREPYTTVSEPGTWLIDLVNINGDYFVNDFFKI